MTTPLMRRALRPLYEAAQDAHPGLLLQRGLPEHGEKDNEAKTKHIERVARQSRVANFYLRAYKRWKQATSDTMRFRSVVLSLESRLFVGLTSGGMVETGCAIDHSHGTPYIPGSSVKGVVNAWAHERFDPTEEGRAIRGELFGMPSDGGLPGLSGLMTFHDAWWVPDSAESPLVPEVVTTHHPDYYGTDGNKPATDFDSPVPNAQIAVRGGFLFVIEGPPAWLELTERMLIAALTTRGIGARTHAGYGLFRVETQTHTPRVIVLQKGAAIAATLYKDERDRWCGRTDDGQEGTVFAQDAVPDDAVEGGTRTLYVRANRPLQFQWEKPALKSPPGRQPARPRRH